MDLQLQRVKECQHHGRDGKQLIVAAITRMTVTTTSGLPRTTTKGNRGQKEGSVINDTMLSAKSNPCIIVVYMKRQEKERKSQTRKEEGADKMRRGSNGGSIVCEWD